MPAGQPTDRYDCDHCGAKLPPPDQSGHRSCQYCGASYAAQSDPNVAGGMTFVIQSPPTMTWDPEQVAKAQKTASKIGCVTTIVIALVVLASVAIPLYFVFGDGEFLDDVTGGAGIGGLDGYRVNAADGAILSGEPTQIDLAVAAQEFGSSDKVIAMLDGDPLELSWTAALGEEAYQVPIRADAEHVYAVDDKRVVALRRSDGAEVWQGSLNDKVRAACGQCFVLVGERIIVQTTDGSIAAFDIADGRPAWNRSLEQQHANSLAVGDAIVLVDGPTIAPRLLVLNAADGTERHVLGATCTDGPSTSLPHSSAVLIPAPDGVSFLIGFGTIPVCLQRWDAVSGAQAWSTTFESGSLFMSITDDVPAVWSDTQVAMGLGDELLVVAPDTGAELFRAQSNEEELWPLGFTPDSLIALVEQSRGSGSFAVRALATDTWTQRWQHGLSGEPTQFVVGTFTDTATAVALSGTNVRIVGFDDESQQLSVESVDTTTGTASAKTELDPGVSELIPSFDSFGWVGDQAVLNVAGAVVVVDTATAEVVNTWP